MCPTPIEPERVEQIAQALQREVSQRIPSTGTGSDLLATVRERQWINSHVPIGWPEMPKGLGPKLRAYAQKVVRRLLRWYIDPLVEQQNRYNAAVSEALNGLAQRDTASERQLQQQISANYQHLQQQSDLVGGLSAAHYELRRHFDSGDQPAVQRVEQKQQALRQALELARLRIQRLENTRIKPAADAADEASQPARPENAASFDYYLLGMATRGDEQIAERLCDYDDLFRDLRHRQSAGDMPPLPVLDVGCGRGELIGHLRDLGLSAYGIEIDADAAETARQNGLDVRNEDVLTHLSSLPDNALAAITLIQVVEHLPVDDLMQLYALAERRLAPGGFIIAETINPHCLEAVTRYYLLDPSHVSLLPPQLTQMLMEQGGLGNCSIRYLRPVPEPTRLEPVQISEGSDGALDRNIERLNDFLFGPQDYAVVGYRLEA